MYLPKAITVLALTIATAFPADRDQPTVWQNLDSRERADAAIAPANARAGNAPRKFTGCAVDEAVSDKHADVERKASKRPIPTGAIVIAKDARASGGTFQTVTAHPAWVTEDAATEVAMTITQALAKGQANAVSPQWPWPTRITKKNDH